MRSVVTHVAWSVFVCVFYCLLVTSVSPANSAEPIERVVLFYAGTAD